MGKGNKGDDNRDPADIPGTPEYAAKHSDDAYCTECHTWYNSADAAQVNRHAH